MGRVERENEEARFNCTDAWLVRPTMHNAAPQHLFSHGADVSLVTNNNENAFIMSLACKVPYVVKMLVVRIFVSCRRHMCVLRFVTCRRTDDRSNTFSPPIASPPFPLLLRPRMLARM